MMENRSMKYSLRERSISEQRHSPGNTRYRGSWWQWVCEEDECKGDVGVAYGGGEGAFFHKTKELADEEYVWHWHMAHDN